MISLTAASVAWALAGEYSAWRHSLQQTEHEILGKHNRRLEPLQGGFLDGGFGKSAHSFSAGAVLRQARKARMISRLASHTLERN
jgi:hypothetical protein